ncbi:MAG: riboflavin synthase [Candidatus Obscuribacterales bacterium]|nr:riboflavin synthase [Candidatus Obscuribacterales bacterium]
MFSGIVEEVGVIVSFEEIDDGKRIVIATDQLMTDGKEGESISVDGTCLTVVDFGAKSFTVEAVAETLRCTTLGELKKGDRVNLEKALKASDRLGGHLVTGHVDCVAGVEKIEQEGVLKLIKFSLAASWAPFFVKKGSVTVSGVSLTVADCGPLLASQINYEESFWFSVALIPHTLAVTTMGSLSLSSRVNIETDIVARYVVRLLGDSYMENLNKVRDSLFIGGNEG